ncbi:MAG TPA: hypothetical protein VNO50_00425 [Pyrinomonadaceae bacterium]|nr:hypothetical protein [Pyrinomonadaceae bacterium]
MTSEKNYQRVLLLLILAASLSLSCAPIQPTNPTGPRGGANYPVILAEDSARRESAQASFSRLSQSLNGRNAETGASKSAPVDLSPITATITSLPAANGSVYLPKVGAGAVMNEEETRESLRRFLRDWRDVIGSEPARLSLVDHVVQPDGTAVVNYEQRPFRFPIRGNYGKLQIRFTAADRRILTISSTCIPEADRLRSALRGLGATGALSARLTADEATRKLRDSVATASESTPATTAPRLPASAQLTPRELVTHVQPSKTRTDALEFRVAWEIEITGAQAKLGYVDAITGEVFSVE